MKNKATPVEVLIFTYNQEKYIEAAIKSVLAQVTTFEFKIRLHDDHSSDDTVLIAKEILQKSGLEHEIFVQKSNQYQVGMNFFAEAIMNTDCEFLALLDGDDLWVDSSKLQTQFDVMIQNQLVSICHHPFGFLRGDKPVFQDWRPAHLRRQIVSGHHLAEQNFIGASTVMLRTSQLPQRIPFGFNNLKIGDYPLWALISKNSYIYEVDSFMSLYREHETNIFAGLDIEEKRFRDAQARAFIATQVDQEQQRLWIDGLVKAIRSHLDVDLLEQKIEELNQELADSKITAQILTSEINALLGSTSWKVTSWLRKLSQLLKWNS